MARQTSKKIQPGDNALFKLSKLLRRKREPIGALNYNSKTAMTDDEKANLLADFYEKTHDLDLENRNLSDRQRVIMNLARTVEETNYDIDKNYLKNNLTNPREVRDLIKNLPKNKAPGLDKITNEALKQLGRKPVCQLHYIINAT